MPRHTELPNNVSLIGKTKTKSGNEKNLYSVNCLFCGKARNITRHDHATRLAKHPCKSCSNKNNNPQGEIQGIRVSWFNKFKLSAIHRSLEWDINIEYIASLLVKQNYKCVLSNLDICAAGNFNDITASIDRIDNSKGYTQKNVQLVHKRINMMRASLPVEDFVLLCNHVANKVKW